MRKIAGSIALILVLSIGTFFIAKKYLYLNITTRGVTSSLVPPSKSVKNHLPQSPTLGSTFSIPSGMTMDIYADLQGGLPRVMTFDQNDNLLVSLPSSGKVMAILDTNKDGKSDIQVDVLTNLDKPHGIVVYKGYLYVAQTDKVSRFSYDADNQTAVGEEKLFDLPGGGRHFTRTIKIHDDKLYTSVGSSCDVCVEKNPYRASILESNLDGSNLKVFASGLRNTVFFTFDNDGRLWGNDMGRDKLGDNLPPDELNIVEKGGNYGWPYCFGQMLVDRKFMPDNPYYCSQTKPSAFDYPAHSAPLGIVAMGSSFLVAFHGSWNSSVPVGYKIVKVDTLGGQAVKMENYVSGFLTDTGETMGRPVDLIFDSKRRLLISDDYSGVIYILYR